MRTFYAPDYDPDYPQHEEKWTADEDRVLREQFVAGKDDFELAVMFGRTSQAIQSRRLKFKLIRKSGRRPVVCWSLAQDAALRGMFAQGIPYSVMGEMLGHAGTVCEWRCRKLGLGPKPPHRRAKGAYRLEERLLVGKLLRQRCPAREIAKHLEGRTRNSVIGFIHRNREKLMALAREQAVSGPQPGSVRNGE